jgi:hypothetical protein
VQLPRMAKLLLIIRRKYKIPLQEEVGVDAANSEIVVLDQTSEGEFHGHVRTWDELTSQMQNALKEAGLTTSNGAIIK